MAGLIAKKYGDALFEAAKENGRSAVLREEAPAVLAVLQRNPELLDVMGHPQLTSQKKRELLRNIFAGKISGELEGLLYILAEKGRFEEAEQILLYVVEREMAERRIGKACVTTPFALSKKEKRAVKARLSETTGLAGIEVDYRVEPALLGGMVIRIGDRMMDCSVRTRLQELTRQL